jgi:hypothetical protein
MSSRAIIILCGIITSVCLFLAACGGGVDESVGVGNTVYMTASSTNLAVFSSVAYLNISGASASPVVNSYEVKVKPFAGLSAGVSPSPVSIKNVVVTYDPLETGNPLFPISPALPIVYTQPGQSVIDPNGTGPFDVGVVDTPAQLYIFNTYSTMLKNNPSLTLRYRANIRFNGVEIFTAKEVSCTTATEAYINWSM